MWVWAYHWGWCLDASIRKKCPIFRDYQRLPEILKGSEDLKTERHLKVFQSLVSIEQIFQRSLCVFERHSKISKNL
jgi:hypothetical protein